MINVAAGDAAELDMRMLDDRLEDRRRSQLALRPKRMRGFAHAPAVVAAALDSQNRFPQILADFAGPQIAAFGIEAELPRLPQAIGPDLGPRSGQADKGIVFRNAVRPAVGWMIDVDPQH